MRILALTNLYPNPHQPHRAAFNRQQFAALAAEHEVRVIAPISWSDEWGVHRRGRQTSGLIADRTRVCDGMMVHHPRYMFTPKVLRNWYGHFLAGSVRDCFRRAVEIMRPDVVLGCWAYPDGWAAVRLARESGLPVVVKVHGSDVLTLDEQPAKRRGTIEALTSCDAVVTVSRQLSAQAIALGVSASRAHVVYNGVDTSVFSPGSRGPARERLRIAGTDPLILFIGNLVPVKGLGVLLDALVSVSRSGLRFQCVLVGSGPLKGQIERRLESEGLGASIRLIGSLSHDRLPDYYRAADLLVLPSRSEGVPNVLLEAGACGTPFLASNVGGIPEIAPPDSLFRPGDPSALAERISEILGPKKQTPARSGFVTGSWTDSARALARVLQEAIAHSSHGKARAA